MSFKKDLEKVEKEIDKEVKEIEGWIIERRKFFIKLGWVVGIIAILLILSHLYLRVAGVGF
jgi:hypothetical protein